MTQRFLILAVALLCLLVSPTTALAAHQLQGAKIDPSVQLAVDTTGGDEAVPVLVYAPAATQAVADALPQGVDTTPLPIIGALAAYLTPNEIESVAAEDFVHGIVADNPIYGVDYRSSMDITNLTIGLGDLAAPADGGPTGLGVTVAIVDSGISAQQDLGEDRIVGWKDFVKGKKKPYDDAGHGTFVAGLIAGDGRASLPLEDGGIAEMQYRGVAPGADLVAIKVLDEFGQGRASTVIAGIAWAIAHKDDYGIRVLNLSVGANPVTPASKDPVALAVEAAWKHGIVVVCAAGNEGEFGLGGVLSPGNDPYVISVGADDTRQTDYVSDDAVTAYSSRGPTLYDEIAKPDLVAPGNRVVSLRVKGSYIDRTFPENLIPVSSYAPAARPSQKPAYLKLSGTSTSAPVVAGAVALMLQGHRSLTPDDVKLRLMETADPLYGASVYEQGAGLLDVDGALASKSEADGYALSADLGDGTTILGADAVENWTKYAWTKYAWTKYKWTKYKWTKYAWTKYKWTKYAWTKYAWTKYAWTKYAWTILGEGQ
jgi:serine protease AprX